MPRPLRTSALMISTFSVSITMSGSMRAVMKNSSTARRVFEPGSNSTNGWRTRSCGRIFRLRDSGCLAAVTSSSSSCSTGTVTRSG